MSVREKPSTSSGTTFVRGGEALAAPNRRKKGDVNTTLGSVGFTAEETTSFYGKLVGLPSNVRLRTQLLPDVNPAASLGDSTGWMLPAADVESRVSSSCDPPNKLSESNIGFQLLKKSGWNEGTGLGATEQGRLNPVEPQLKQDRLGIGAELKTKKRVKSSYEERQHRREASKDVAEDVKEKGLSKKARKARAKAEREQQEALSKAFYREFWPENV